MLQDVFVNWVAEKVNERNEELVVKKKLAIEMDPEIAAVFKASTKTSGRPDILFFILILLILCSTSRIRSPHA